MRKQLWRQQKTGQVVETTVVRPALYDFLHAQVSSEMIEYAGWEKCDIDPGYRGILDDGEAKSGRFNDDDQFAP